MKKLILLLSLTGILFGAMAKEQPNVIVHKTNGGHWAWLNLYNDINYTPSSENEPAHLDCFGDGWSLCRIPHLSTNNTCSLGEHLSVIAQNAVSNAINELISESEEMGSRGIYMGQSSRTIAAPCSGNTKSMDTYFVRATWEYSTSGESTMYVYISKSDILNHRQ